MLAGSLRRGAPSPPAQPPLGRWRGRRPSGTGLRASRSRMRPAWEQRALSRWLSRWPSSCSLNCSRHDGRTRPLPPRAARHSRLLLPVAVVSCAPGVLDPSVKKRCFCSGPAMAWPWPCPVVLSWQQGRGMCPFLREWSESGRPSEGAGLVLPQDTGGAGGPQEGAPRPGGPPVPFDPPPLGCHLGRILVPLVVPPNRRSPAPAEGPLWDSGGGDAARGACSLSVARTSPGRWGAAGRPGPRRKMSFPALTGP